MEQSTQETIWKVAGAGADAAKNAQELSAHLAVSPIVARLLSNRGYSSPADAQKFLRPSLEHLFDPEALDGITQAVERISKAIAAGERILVYGDYDVDGMTAAALLHHLFALLGAGVSCFLPSRAEEGYGLNADRLREFKDQGVDLVITVDCGIGANREAQVARDLGIDLIITDHHEPEGPLPDALAVVNPKKTGSAYPYRDLAGVGVAFKLAWGIARHFSPQRRVSEEFREFLLNAMGLVALGTVADVVPLTGENRVLVRYGLDALVNTRLPGIRALMSSVRTTDRLTARDLAFRLAPRLNAAGRLNEPLVAFELLTTESFGRAMVIVKDLEAKNRRRRAIERKILDAVSEELRESFNPDRSRVILLARKDWHPGVLGIVASRIAEEYYRPTILLNIEGDVAGGSARSIPPFHLFDALKSCEGVLLKYGGHAQAAGLSVETSRVDDLREALESAAALLTPEDLAPTITVDADVSISDMTVSLVRQLEALAPFGEKNPSPLFAARDVALAGRMRRVGSDGQHLSFFVRDGAAAVRAIAFGMGDFEPKLKAHSGPVSIAFEPQIDTFRGSGEAQLVVRDIHLD